MIYVFVSFLSLFCEILEGSCVENITLSKLPFWGILVWSFLEKLIEFNEPLDSWPRFGDISPSHSSW